MFLWGAATSSHQIEGHNRHNDWWQWESTGKVEGGVRSGAATDHWNRYREDLRLASELGLNSYRFSVEWSRIEPRQGEWDSSALDWYLELIHECERRGLVPMLTLHHFTSPQWFAEMGGFSSPQAAILFQQFVRKVAATLGPRVPLWCTLNEPMVLAVGSYLGQFMPPAVYSPELFARACHELLKSHVLAYDVLHSEIPERSGPWKERPIEVGIAHNLLHFMPDRRWHLIENILTQVLSRFYNRSWLDAVIGKKQNFGVPRLIPQARPVTEALGRRTVDFIGVNYYTKAYVQWMPNRPSLSHSTSLPIHIAFAKHRETVSDLGWAIHPKGFREVIQLAGNCGLPLYITENGIADRDDRHRSEYLFSHLREVADSTKRGIEIRGYYHWSLLDNFEWIKGFGPRFGLYEVDYETFERRRRPSAELYHKIISVHGGSAPQLERFGS